MVPGLSTSSSSSLPSSTSMTPSRQEIDHPTSSSSSSTSPTTTVSSDSETRAQEDLSGIDSYPVTKPTQNPKPNKNEDHEFSRGDPCHSEILEWLQEFRENLVDDRVPENRDSHASSSHELSLKPTPTGSVDLGKHSVYTHFPTDRNWEICQRTKITRAPCRRRIGGAVPRAEHFGDLITADHKVPSEGCESRNNHRYAVVVQDLATQWIQSYPCKTKTSQETPCKSSWSRIGSPKSVTLTTPCLWRSFLESLYVDTTQIGNKWDCWESSTQSERRYVCSTVAIRSGWKMVGRFHGMLYLSAKHSRSLVWWDDAIWKTFWRTSWRTNYPVWFIGWVLPYLCERPVKNPSIWKESLTWIVPWIRSVRGGKLEGWHNGCRHLGVRNDGRIRNLLKKDSIQRK